MKILLNDEKCKKDGQHYYQTLTMLRMRAFGALNKSNRMLDYQQINRQTEEETELDLNLTEF